MLPQYFIHMLHHDNIFHEKYLFDISYNPTTMIISRKSYPNVVILFAQAK
jgi:hypothetical protein